MTVYNTQNHDPQKGSQNRTKGRKGTSGEDGTPSEAGEEYQFERQFTLSISDEDRKKSFEIEDWRWSQKEQAKDWLKVGLMVAIMWAWMLAVYFLEPGLR